MNPPLAWLRSRICMDLRVRVPNRCMGDPEYASRIVAEIRRPNVLVGEPNWRTARSGARLADAPRWV
jgi:hypothetical protein